MSALLFLQADDFIVQQGQKGDILCHTIKGFSVVLFYSTQCVHCHALIPIFKQLPGTIANCQFAMINVSMQKNVIKMSQRTVSPITVVPYIVFYVNGKPFIRYNGPKNSTDIRKFIVDVSRNLQNKQKFFEETNEKQMNERKIPEYSVGLPKECTEEGVCYLDYEEAYNK
jgi:thiol-disulfide isomerase/thioredoxin